MTYSSFLSLILLCGFNPHTHEGCDGWWTCEFFECKVSIHTPTKGVTFYHWFYGFINLVSIHTPTKGVTDDRPLHLRLRQVSIHTPTKGVTQINSAHQIAGGFQSTHPRRVWQKGCIRWAKSIFVSIHTPTKGVTICCLHAVWSSRVSIHTPTKGVTQNRVFALAFAVFQSTHPRRVWLTINQYLYCF